MSILYNLQACLWKRFISLIIWLIALPLCLYMTSWAVHIVWLHRGSSRLSSIAPQSLSSDLQVIYLQVAYLQVAYLQVIYLQVAYLQVIYLQVAYLQVDYLQVNYLQIHYLQVTYLQIAYLQVTHLQVVWLQVTYFICDLKYFSQIKFAEFLGCL